MTKKEMDNYLGRLVYLEPWGRKQADVLPVGVLQVLKTEKGERYFLVDILTDEPSEKTWAPKDVEYISHLSYKSIPVYELIKKLEDRFAERHKQARSMFEKLGYEFYLSENNYNIVYRRKEKDQDGGQVTIAIHFEPLWRMYYAYRLIEAKEEIQPYSITQEEHIAIAQQMKELGLIK